MANANGSLLYSYGSSNPFDDRTAGVNYSNNYVSSPSYGGNDTGYGSWDYAELE